MMPHDHLVEHHPKGVYVTLRVPYIVCDCEFFRSDKAQGSLSAASKVVAFVKETQSEISQLINVLPDEYIVWFDILVEDLLIEQHLIAVHALVEDVIQLLLFKVMILLVGVLLVESASLAILHEHVVVLG